MCFSAVMQDEAALLAIESRYRSLSVLMDERMRRQWAAAESRAYGWGGVRAVGSVIGMSPNTIRKGLEELAVRDENPDAPVEPGLRRSGAGRDETAGDSAAGKGGANGHSVAPEVFSWR